MRTFSSTTAMQPLSASHLMHAASANVCPGNPCGSALDTRESSCHTGGSRGQRGSQARFVDGVAHQLRIKWIHRRLRQERASRIANVSHRPMQG
jgi:hypothetical protein